MSWYNPFSWGAPEQTNVNLNADGTDPTKQPGYRDKEGRAPGTPEWTERYGTGGSDTFAPWNDVYDWGKGVYNDIKHAANAPYDEKRRGIEGIQARLDALKQERLARMDALYGRADAKYDDTRAAMSAAYGDPSTWKL